MLQKFSKKIYIYHIGFNWNKPKVGECRVHLGELEQEAGSCFNPNSHREMSKKNQGKKRGGRKSIKSSRHSHSDLYQAEHIIRFIPLNDM